ncbi:hypothetical protein [Reinekea marinisedimentorum]|uniref:Uncharacterized protein n=1 Tax=Reinekea marinisedimentorum TaxID=230495 RepID=A0A4R3I3Z3_9GAMM|nr:hypothetical protein [Reinekea marinisedimentorum]TCS40014.1 hypothetical protein BCF53_111109 [Reinekea marinisedimentorum]
MNKLLAGFGLTIVMATSSVAFAAPQKAQGPAQLSHPHHPSVPEYRPQTAKIQPALHSAKPQAAKIKPALHSAKPQAAKIKPAVKPQQAAPIAKPDRRGSASVQAQGINMQALIGAIVGRPK